MARFDAVAMVDFVPGDDGALLAVLDDREDPRAIDLSPARLSERERLVAALRCLVGRGADSLSFWRTGSPLRDEHIAEFEVSRRALREWDLLHVVAPLLSALPDRRTLLLQHGRPRLPWFNLRGSLRAALTGRMLSRATWSRLTALSLWSGAGAQRLWTQACGPGLPLVLADRIHVVVGPPPDPSPDQEPAIAAWNESLRAGLRTTAAACGARVTFSATREALREILAGAPPQTTLSLVVHQAQDVLHLEGGGVTVQELASWLHAHPTLDLAAIDLAVCGAGGQNNLADCFQATGCPCVMTHGERAHYARSLGLWCGLLDLCAAGPPRLLPELVEANWLARSADSSR